MKSETAPPKRKQSAMRMSDRFAQAGRQEPAEVLKVMDTQEDGLSPETAEARFAEFGPNACAEEKGRSAWLRLRKALANPLVILLSVLSAVSFATGDPRAGTVMALMVILGVALRFVQEAKADAAAAKLKAMISVTATVIRAGREIEIPLGELVPGDVVKLAAGDMVPADVRLLSSKDLFVTQSALTGESLPSEKHAPAETRADVSPIEFVNLCFLGTSVESGTAKAVVVETGPRTYFGTMAASLGTEPIETSFDKGIHKFTWLMIRFMLVMVPLVFVINGISKHDWKEAFFFSLAIAVGLTPEMLPMIVSVCLSRGAVAMSKHKVIVKRLNAIQNFGAMDVLCTDKTGTLTMDRVILEKYCNVLQQDDEKVLLDAYLLSYFQTGLRNVLDRAVLKHRDAHQKFSLDEYLKVDEIPFDFVRRMMSVCVETLNHDRLFLTKGAPEAVFAQCTHFELDGEIFPMEPILVGDLITQYRELSADGFRVLAVAYKYVDRRDAYTKADESDLILRGYLAFLDPPKDSAATAIAALQGHGIRVKVLTGDNDLVTRKVCREVGIPADNILLGSKVETMSDADLRTAVENHDIFARLAPAHKQRIIETLRFNGHVVGFLGDGINDAPALRAADVGVSVNTAVDIAKESADVILLENSLTVLDEGVIEGRKVFVNILKYIRMGASSNFGNMFSVLGASAWLKFLPMQPIQVLTNNLLYDFSQVPIPGDTVGPDQTAKPSPWKIGEITRFILMIGPISSIFDYTTFALMWFYFKCNQLNLLPPPELASRFAGATDPDQTYSASLFHSGWFVESLMTQTLIIHVIRTKRIPFIQGRASWQLTMTTLLIMAFSAWLPYSPLAEYLGLVPLPAVFWSFLFVTLLCYMTLTQVVKMWLIRKRWL
jgi:Mg2+-importing ATPase